MPRGFLGGTFDPIHLGHLDVARAAQQALALESVSFLPSNVPPHRRMPLASAADRFAMVSLAVRDAPGFAVSRLDLDAEGPSYTLATLDRLAALGTPLNDVFFITGADAFREIALWKGYPGILDRCHFVAVSRPGCPASSLRAALPELSGRMRDAAAPAPAASAAVILVDAPTAPVSSTEIRQRLAGGQSIKGLVPDAVAAYIHDHGLYRSRSNEKGPDA